MLYSQKCQESPGGNFEHIYCNSINNTFLGFDGDHSVIFESGVIIFVTNCSQQYLMKPQWLFHVT